ncbi:hypothetical protein SLNSH_05860 [Alsobacter soli]|uniref:histidine kinase n=1 Tax=Alsobacter soli TaxID=2109933 RepID=A0A2T1HWD3_9HYPH|nr:ATP-binding protein [Alsobacter soli]PSC05905.1 hypothetical protein SLNSH_05860 [Alsobacter soli]
MADSALFDSRIPEAGAGDTSALREPDLALLRTILDSIPGRVAFVDFANRYVYVNREFLAFHGRTADQVIGRHVRDVLGEAAYRQVSVYNERIRAGEVVRWEGWITYASAGRRYVQQTYTPYSPGGGAPQGNIAFGRDLTDLKLAEAEIERQRSRIADIERLSAMGALLAGVAHELNNPLAIVLAQSTLLVERATTEDVRARAERIQAAAERSGRIVRSFLGMAREAAPTRRPAQLNEIVRAALDMMGYGLRGAGVTVKTHLDPDLPSIEADADLLGQVVSNLVLNAQQALSSLDGARLLSLRTRRDGGSVVLEIEDNGPGVPPAIAQRIFEPYFTTKGPGAGTGIGLALCRNIVAAHGGTIAAEPARGGAGALFRVTLPASPAGRQGATAAGG